MAAPRVQPIDWKDDRVVILDQTRLPQEEHYVTCDRVGPSRPLNIVWLSMTGCRTIRHCLGQPTY